MSEKSKAYYTSREAAELLGVAVSTIQLWTNNGSLSAWTTDGGHRRITRKSIDEMFNQQKAVTGNRAEDYQLSIVIVEDNAQQIRLYKKQLNSLGINLRIVTASDGYEGLIKIGATIPDIIITDLKMPNFNGLQMVNTLGVMLELQNSLIIAITGLQPDEIKEMGSFPNKVKLFTKPVSFPELEILIRSKLKQKTGYENA
jgi:excisionase family DNA binding protein